MRKYGEIFFRLKYFMASSVQPVPSEAKDNRTTMGDLTYAERANIEKFLRMKTGYVMEFSDRTFQEIVGDPLDLT